MYCTKNFRTKKQLRDAVQAWNEYNADPDAALWHGWRKPMPVTYYQPGPFGGNEPQNGTIYVEGPHYPQPHKFYAQCEVKDGVIVKVKK